ncbi:MAG: HAD hydrolase family protein [Candidatus Gastranaerophilaceae bacterium]|jgi:hydroxymethylpyrimidine pyrophosphatase-like HAD family hydrolase
MRKTLYISDLDGTLLNSDKQISRFTASTLSALIDAVCFFHTQRRARMLHRQS